MKKILILLALLFFAVRSFEQTHRVDDLRTKLSTAKNNRERLMFLVALLDERSSLSTDTFHNYILQAKKIAPSLNDKSLIGQIIIAEISYYFRVGNTDTTKQIVDQALKNYSLEVPSERHIYFELMGDKINFFDYTNDLKSATAFAYSLIKDAEKYNDSEIVAGYYNSLACFNYDLDFNRQAIEYQYKALSFTRDSPHFYDILSGIYVNLGEVYWWINKLDSAEYFIRKGIDYSKKKENLYRIYWGMQKLANIKIKQKRFAEAENEVLQSIAIYKQINGNVPNLNNIKALAKVYRSWGKTDTAIHQILQAIEADSLYYKTSKNYTKDPMEKMFLLDLLSKCYMDKKDYKNESAVLRTIIEMKDTIYQKNAASAMEEMQVKYETQKKEATILQQKYQLTKRNYVLYGTLGLALLSLIVARIIFVQNHKKQQLKFNAV